jgi:manganese/zinc/iron transport system ATP- binding protein
MQLSDLAYRQISQLSGGQQQRALLARALAQEADLLLLDEPLNAIDAATRRIVSEVLQALHLQGKTVIAATHELERLNVEFDAALYLVDGHVASPEEGGDRLPARGRGAATFSLRTVTTGAQNGLAH